MNTRQISFNLQVHHHLLRRVAVAALCGTVLVLAPSSSPGQSTNLQFIPERFGVIDVIPTDQSGEIGNQAEPTVAGGINDKYAQWVLHAFGRIPSDGINTLYTSQSFISQWANGGTMIDFDATLDWSPGGTCYAAIIPAVMQISVLQSANPVLGAGFSLIPGSTINRGNATNYPDQPYVRVANVTNTDHIFVGFNDLSQTNGKTATVRFSLDGGSTWRESVLEKTTPGAGQDSPSIRLAISADGKIVYALFQRWNSAVSSGDVTGDVVLMRDDNSGGSGFGALGNGHVIVHDVILPRATPLGGERVYGGGCSVAVNPNDSSQVYVAYTEIISGAPTIRVLRSTDSGNTWSYVLFGPANASLPALAVSRDGTFGMLYLEKPGTSFHVNFLKAFGGNFDEGSLRTSYLAIWQDGDPKTYRGLAVGDYFDLRTINYNFYGTFCASGKPDPADFPSGVYYQRNVKFLNGSVQNNFWLGSPGSTLVNTASNNVAYSIDPFFFYDIAPQLKEVPQISLTAPRLADLSDPLTGTYHLAWAALGANEPQFDLMTSPSLGTATNWGFVSPISIIKTNGEFVAPLGSLPQAYYRLQQDAGSGQFRLFTTVGANGSLTPSGILTNSGFQSQTFTAAPSNNYAVSKWYLDGVVVGTNTSSFTLSNIVSEHILAVTFVPINDLAVSVFEQGSDEGPPLVYQTNRYVIGVENTGINSLTKIAITNILPVTVNFVSAAVSKGIVTNTGGTVTAQMAGLAPGEYETLTINFVPLVEGSATNRTTVGCNQSEPDLSNNSATNIITVLNPVVVTNQPASQNVATGGTAFFSVGVSGTPPFTYEWFFNSTNLLSVGTNATLTLPNVTPAQAGSYSVSVFQILSPEDIVGADSTNAVLTVH